MENTKVLLVLASSLMVAVVWSIQLEVVQGGVVICDDIVDVVIVLDESQNMIRDDDGSNYGKVLSLVRLVGNAFPFASNCSRAALIEFGSPVEPDESNATLGAVRTRFTLADELDNVQFDNKLATQTCVCDEYLQWTYTWQALDAAHAELLNNGRESAHKVVILITAGDPKGKPGNTDDPPWFDWTRAAANRIKGDGILLVTLGIGTNFNVSFLEEISSGIGFAMVRNDFNQLPSAVLDLARTACNARKPSGTPQRRTSFSSETCIPNDCPDQHRIGGWGQPKIIGDLEYDDLPKVCECDFLRYDGDCSTGAKPHAIDLVYSGNDCGCDQGCLCPNNNKVVQHSPSINPFQGPKTDVPVWIKVVEFDLDELVYPGTILEIREPDSKLNLPSMLTLEISAAQPERELAQTVYLDLRCGKLLSGGANIGSLIILSIEFAQLRISGNSIPMAAACPGLDKAERASACEQICTHLAKTNENCKAWTLNGNKKQSCMLYSAHGGLKSSRANHLSGLTCSTLPTKTPSAVPTPGPFPGCNDKGLEMVFVLDESTSINEDDSSSYGKIIAFVRELTKKLDVSPSNTRVAVIEFGSPFYDGDGQLQSSSRKRLGLTQGTSQSAIEAVIDDLDCLCDHELQYTHTWEGLGAARDELAQNSRPGTTAVVVLITDGVPFRNDGTALDKESKERTSLATDELKRMGVQIITLGVGPKSDEEILSNIASTPQHHFLAMEFENLDSLVDVVATQACVTLSPTTSLRPTLAPTQCVKYDCLPGSISPGTYDPFDSKEIPGIRLSHLPDLCGCTWFSESGPCVKGNRLSSIVAILHPVSADCRDCNQRRHTYIQPISPPSGIASSVLYVTWRELGHPGKHSFPLAPGNQFVLRSAEERFRGDIEIAVSADRFGADVFYQVVLGIGGNCERLLKAKKVGSIEIIDTVGREFFLHTGERTLNLASACPSNTFEDNGQACQALCTHFAQRRPQPCVGFSAINLGPDIHECKLYYETGDVVIGGGRRYGGPCPA